MVVRPTGAIWGAETNNIWIVLESLVKSTCLNLQILFHPLTLKLSLSASKYKSKKVNFNHPPPKQWLSVNGNPKRTTETVTVVMEKDFICLCHLQSCLLHSCSSACSLGHLSVLVGAWPTEWSGYIFDSPWINPLLPVVYCELLIVVDSVCLRKFSFSFFSHDYEEIGLST